VLVRNNVFLYRVCRENLTYETNVNITREKEKRRESKKLSYDKLYNSQIMPLNVLFTQQNHFLQMFAHNSYE
jgi:hypothetical protein